MQLLLEKTTFSAAALQLGEESHWGFTLNLLLTSGFASVALSQPAAPPSKASLAYAGETVVTTLLYTMPPCTQGVCHAHQSVRLLPTAKSTKALSWCLASLLATAMPCPYTLICCMASTISVFRGKAPS